MYQNKLDVKRKKEPMSRRSSKPKTAVQQAIVDMRRQLGLTQLELAIALDVTPITITRWETSYPPRENGLFKLGTFAHQRGELIWASIFDGALEQAEEIRYRRGTRMADDSLDFEAAISNVYRAVTAHADPRLMAHWVQILNVLIPAHRLVIRRAIQDKLPAEEKPANFKADDLSDLLKKKIEELINLNQRLIRYRNEIAAQKQVSALRDLDRRLSWHLKEAHSGEEGLGVAPRQIEKTEQATAVKSGRKPTKRKTTK